MNFNDIFNNFSALEFIRPYWLVGIAVIFIFNLWRHQQSKQQQSGIIASHLSEHLVTLPETTKRNRLALNSLFIIACLALSGPSIRSLDIPVYEMQKAQVIAFDLSFSMYATDVQPNRLSQAKYKAIDLLKQWGEGEKALIAYAGDAFTISPLTQDSHSIINHVKNLSPELMPVRGSRPDLALQKTIDLLQNAGYQQGHIVFISDGFDANSEQKMQQMLEDSQWIVSVLAIGTNAGAPIKLADNSLLKNAQGEIVIPKLNSTLLYPITRLSNGLYLTFDAQGQDVNLLAKHYENQNMRKESDANKQQTNNKQFIDDGYWLSLLLLPLFLLLFRKGLFYVALFALTLPLSSPKLEASVWKNSQQNAYQAYQQGDYKVASEHFEDAQWKAAALFKNKQYQQAEALYSKQSALMPDNAELLYNLANTQAMQQKYEQALSNFNKALQHQPDFKQAVDNKNAVEALLAQKQQDKKQDEKQSEQQQGDEQQSQQQQSEQKNDQQQSQQQSEQQNDQQQSQQQQSEQQNDQQQSQQQQSEQQNDQQQSQQQQSEQQNAQQQQAEQQNDQQQSQQQQAEQQNDQQQSEQQQAEQQSEQQSQQQITEAQQVKEETHDEASSALLTTEQENKEYEDLPIWLKNLPDDPSLLLRNKMQLEYRKRAANKPVLQKHNGEIW